MTDPTPLSKEEKFRDAHVIEVDGVECSVSDSKVFVYLGARCLAVSEARTLRDWLSEVLPS